MAAATAVGDAGHRAGVALLKLKVSLGDPEPEVFTECLASILHLGRDDALGFVGAYLASTDPTMSESAAMALGQVRIKGSERIVIDAIEAEVLGPRRKVLYLSLAMMCAPTAIDHLLSIVTNGPEAEAASALEAFDVLRHDQALMRRLRTARASRVDRKTQSD